MNIVDCTWEKKNLNRHVAEISVFATDVFDEGVIKDIEKRFDYIVIKLPMNHPDFNFGLSKMGYVFIETQMNISKNYSSFNFDDRFIKRLVPHVSESIVSTESELESLISNISQEMFTTDRIYLDRNFPQGSGCVRYKNWLQSEFYNKTGIIKKMLYKDKEVGFSLSRENNGTITALLGGIFENYQSYGLGMLTSSFHFFSARNRNVPFEKMITSISSNNYPVYELYNYLGFKTYQMTYVFVKHV